MTDSDHPAIEALFTAPPDRSGSASTKWERYAGRDVLPFWVADMEFPAPPAVIDALRARVDHGIFGYTQIPAGLRTSLIEHLAARHDWRVEPEWLTWIPGVVPGLNVACRTVGEPSDGVMTAVPIYFPFLAAPGNSSRERVETRLIRSGARWEMDFDAMAETLAAHPRTRLFLFCNPQNPTGRVYGLDELERLAELIDRFDLTLCSDEIHAGLELDCDRPHHPIAARFPEIARRTITLVAPSKTFNLPGLSCACAIIPDPELRRRFKAAGAGVLPSLGPLPMTAAEAAWRHGEPWRQALLELLRGNRDRLQGAVAALPGLAMTHVEGTYLGWIDASALPVKDPHRFFERSGVGLSPGTQFGSPGFVRFNFACPPAMLAEGLRRMRAAIAAL